MLAQGLVAHKPKLAEGWATWGNAAVLGNKYHQALSPLRAWTWVWG